MIHVLSNQARDYAWGSTTLLAEVLGFEATGKPMAEVWFGTHPLSPATLRRQPELSLSSAISHELDFMIKFLAADSPLSIQVHPTEHQAQAGFAAEDAAGIAIDAANRNFKDQSAKREAIVAITPFELLVGLRPIDQIAQALTELSKLLSDAPAALLLRYAALTEASDAHRALLGDILAGDGASEVQLQLLEELAQASIDRPQSTHVDYPLLYLLFQKFGSDRGILLALLMRKVSLRPGESVFVEAGVPHSYLSGLGLEILSASDNVLRGGLSPKHISARDFMAMLDIAQSLQAAPQYPRQIAAGLERYNFGSVEFALHRVSVSGQNLLVDFQLPGESILVCVYGELAVSNSRGEREVLTRGQAAYLDAEAKFYSITGSGEGYLGSSVSL